MIPDPALRALDQLDGLIKTVDDNVHDPLGDVIKRQLRSVRTHVAALAAAEAAPLDALGRIRDKTQAAAYHRNYRQACIDINEIVLDTMSGGLREAAQRVVDLPPHIDAYTTEDRRRIWTEELRAALAAAEAAPLDVDDAARHFIDAADHSPNWTGSDEMVAAVRGLRAALRSPDTETAGEAG